MNPIVVMVLRVERFQLSDRDCEIMKRNNMRLEEDKKSVVGADLGSGEKKNSFFQPNQQQNAKKDFWSQSNCSILSPRHCDYERWRATRMKRTVGYVLYSTWWWRARPCTYLSVRGGVAGTPLYVPEYGTRGRRRVPCPLPSLPAARWV